MARHRRTVLMLALIVAATLLGLVYLTQQLVAAKAAYEIDALLTDRTRLLRDITNQETLVISRSSEPRVIRWAQQQGLGSLGAAVRLPAR